MKFHCYISILITLLYQTLANLHALQKQTPRNVMLQEKLDSLRHLAIIKADILRRLGIAETPRETNSVSVPKQKAEPESDDGVQKYKLADVSSYHSEPSDNFTDENIIQFRLMKTDYRKHIEVNGANLLVRVKLRKDKSKHKKMLRSLTDKKEKRRRKRDKLFKEIDVIVSNVTGDGRPGEVIATLKSKLRKTKLLKVSLPKDVVQKSLDSDEKILQFFVQCKGCNKKTKLILVHKNKKSARRKRKGTSKPKLHKRRPILIVQSHIISNGV